MHRLRLIVFVCAISTIVGASALVGDTIAQQAYVKASNTNASDQFGFAVAISGDTLVVGAVNESSNATGVNANQSDNSAVGSGAAYVFVRNGTTWIQQAYLKASNTGAGDFFGRSVAISGDTIVIGATNEDSNATGIDGNQTNNNAPQSGAAYVFVRSGTTWSQQAYLKASNTGVGDEFGWSVAASGDTVVIGSDLEDSGATGVNGNQASNGTTDSGAVYVFERVGTSWTQQAYLKASNTGGQDYFGKSVAISGDTLIVGAIGERSGSTGVNGNQLDNSLLNAGAAYVFVRSGGTWSQQAYLKASNSGAQDEFGGSVALSGETVVVGASGESSIATGVNGNQTDNSAEDAGAAYVFVRSGENWSPAAYLKASNTEIYDKFGTSVSISGDLIFIGALGEDSSGTGTNSEPNENNYATGAAYLFERNAETWTPTAYVKASNTGWNAQFGSSVTASADTFVVGAPRESSNATGVNGNQGESSAAVAGAAYVFVNWPNVTPGDMNCDTETNIDDVPAFIHALLDPDGFTECNIVNGDTNSNGLVNGADIQGFVDLLVP